MEGVAGVDVTAVIGSPTAHATFDNNTWLYISELTQQRIGRTLGELDQNVIQLDFDENGVLRNCTEAQQGRCISRGRGCADDAVPRNRGFVHAAASGQYRPVQPHGRGIDQHGWRSAYALAVTILRRAALPPARALHNFDLC